MNCSYCNQPKCSCEFAVASDEEDKVYKTQLEDAAIEEFENELAGAPVEQRLWDALRRAKTNKPKRRV